MSNQEKDEEEGEEEDGQWTAAQMVSNYMASWLSLDTLREKEVKLPDKGVFDYDRCRYLLRKETRWFEGRRFIQIRFGGRLVRHLFVLGNERDGQFIIIHELLNAPILSPKQSDHYYYFPIRLSTDFQRIMAFGSFVDRYHDWKSAITIEFVCNNLLVLCISSERDNPAEQMMLHLDLPIISGRMEVEDELNKVLYCCSEAVNLIVDFLPVPIEGAEWNELLSALITLPLPKELRSLIGTYCPGKIPNYRTYKSGWHLPKQFYPISKDFVKKIESAEPLFD